VTQDGVRRRRPRAHTGEQAVEKAVFEATEGLLASHPLHELSVAQIIAAAGISRGSFYHYFSDKYEVVASLMGRIWGEIYSETHTELEAPWTDPGAALRSTLSTALGAWSEHQSVINAVLENRDVVPALAEVWTEVASRFAAVLRDQIRRERTAGRSGDGPPPEVVATMLVCGAERIFYVGSTGSDPRLATPKQRLDAIVTIALAAIYGNPNGPNGATKPAPQAQRSARRTTTTSSSSPATPADHASDDVRTTMLAATTELLQTTPLNDLTVAQILAASGVARGTFYFYFASKQDVFSALLTEVMSTLTDSFAAIISDRSIRLSPEQLRQAVGDWLRFDSPKRAVLRSAVEEWPRQPEVRAIYLAAHSQLVSELARAIESDRRSKVAMRSIPSAQLATAWMWTMERSWYESVGGAAHLADTPLVNDALAAGLVAAVYGDTPAPHA
jgi:TetR/AcrR family transcriptional regulator, ethionamide resistance regulator